MPDGGPKDCENLVLHPHELSAGSIGVIDDEGGGPQPVIFVKNCVGIEIALLFDPDLLAPLAALAIVNAELLGKPIDFDQLAALTDTFRTTWVSAST